MGEQVDLQQARVFLLNGQTIILEGDVGESAINDINAEILEQALQETASNGHSQNPTQAECNNTLANQVSSIAGQANQPCDGTFDENDPNNFVAIFENENGETQTVQLTLEQAAALGFQVATDDTTEKKQTDHVTQNDIKESNHSFTQQTEVAQLPVAVSTVPQIGQQRRNAQGQGSNMLLNSLLKPAPSPLISLVPQYTSNAMQYSVKLAEPILNSPDVPVPVTDFLSEANQSAPITMTSNTPQTISMSQGTSLLNQQKLAVLPIASKNLSSPIRPVVRLKPSTTTVASPAIIRTAATKTIIPKIQGTPTSMANISMSSALPISSTASMVRVLNTPSNANVKPATAAGTTVSTAPVKCIDTSSVPLAATNTTKPLGSSENPIQLVQHGQTFHSMQPLSQEQLKQIATVLQQKQLDTSRNSKNVLYDASTNTRIIYRVVYPEDLALKKPTPGTTVSSTTSVRGRGASSSGGRKGRPPKSLSKVNVTRRHSDEDDDQMTDADLSKGEKEERKKVLPRTRSGRLSRPPRHMVKDYKRIHHLDFAEPDLDDSDGGYSDYRISDSEATEVNPDAMMDDVPNLLSLPPLQPLGNPATKRAIHSKFRCPTCKKMYLGYRRLARHFESYPDHGSMDDVPRGPSHPPADTGGTSDAVNGKTGVLGRARGRRRGSHFTLSPAERAERRKAKLRELLSGYDPSDIAEIAGPMVAQFLDSWQLLMLRITACEDHPTHLASLFSELRTLLETAQSRVAEVLSAQTIPTDISQVHKVQLNDVAVASALNISCGVYDVMESDDKRLQWHPSNFSFQSITSSALSPDSLPQPQTHKINSIMNENAAKKMKLWTEHTDSDNNKIVDSQSDKNFLDITIESEKPSDTSMGSDTPLDDIVKAELKNLASKSGLEDFVAPPPPAPPPVNSSNLGQVVDFVTSTFSATVQDTVNESHFPPDLVMDMPNVGTSAEQLQSVNSDPSKLPPMHYELPSSSPTSRLDLSGASIDVHLDSQLEEATHELDFEALSEEFNRNTNS